MKLKPLGNQIVALRVDANETTKSGLYVPNAAQTLTQEAVVVSVGEGRPLASTGEPYKIPINVDDRVLFRRNSEIEVTVEETKYLILDVDAVLAVIEE